METFAFAGLAVEVGAVTLLAAVEPSIAAFGLLFANTGAGVEAALVTLEYTTGKSERKTGLAVKLGTIAGFAAVELSVATFGLLFADTASGIVAALSVALKCAAGKAERSAGGLIQGAAITLFTCIENTVSALRFFFAFASAGIEGAAIGATQRAAIKATSLTTLSSEIGAVALFAGIDEAISTLYYRSDVCGAAVCGSCVSWLAANRRSRFLYTLSKSDITALVAFAVAIFGTIGGTDLISAELAVQTVGISGTGGIGRRSTALNKEQRQQTTQQQSGERGDPSKHHDFSQRQGKFNTTNEKLRKRRSRSCDGEGSRLP